MKYFVFDIDGTLIDSSKVDQWAMRTALAEFGYHFTYEQLIFSFGMPGRRALAKLSIPAERVDRSWLAGKHWRMTGWTKSRCTTASPR